MNISSKTNNKLNNILSNKIENVNIYDSIGVQKLTWVICENFYIGWTNRNLKKRFSLKDRNILSTDHLADDVFMDMKVLRGKDFTSI